MIQLSTVQDFEILYFPDKKTKHNLYFAYYQVVGHICRAWYLRLGTINRVISGDTRCQPLEFAYVNEINRQSVRATGLRPGCVQERHTRLSGKPYRRGLP